MGDLIFIPAGVPHGIRETDGITWFNIRFDTLPLSGRSRPGIRAGRGLDQRRMLP